MANETIESTLGIGSNVYSENTADTDSKFKLGRIGGTSVNGALRFPGITVNQGVTVDKAELHLWSQFSSIVDHDLKADIYGIKETNTSSFGSSPFGRTKTSNKSSVSTTRPSGNYLTINVASIVNEILAQGGWANGNAMGFLCLDNGGTNDCEFEDWIYKSYLDIRVSAVGNLFPTPITVAAPTFPTATDVGIRVSKPTKDVKTVNDVDLHFTSRKKELRVLAESTVTGSGGISHGLSYAPACLGYYVDSSDRLRIMNVPSNVFSVEPFVASNGSVVYAFPEPGRSAYIYIFIDPLT